MEMANDPSVSSYGPDEGLPALREALRHKIRQENGLQGVRCCRCRRCWCCCGAACDGGAGVSHCTQFAGEGSMNSTCCFCPLAPGCGHRGCVPCPRPCTAAVLPLCRLQYDVMITAGANQAFTNIVLALLDATDRVVLFK